MTRRLCEWVVWAQAALLVSCSAEEPAPEPTPPATPPDALAAPTPLTCDRGATRLAGLSTEVRGIALSGDVEYVSDDYGGFRVFDMADAAAPKLLGWLPEVLGLGRGVSVDGQIAWLASADAGVIAIDVANPASPHVVGTVDLPGYTRHVVVRDGVAFAADDWAGFRVLDVSDPTHPTVRGEIQEVRPCFRVEPAWSPGAAPAPGATRVVWIAGGPGGVRVMDVSGDTPVLLTSLETPAHAWDVLKDGDVLYVADDIAGVRVYDVSSPAAPRFLAAIDTPGHARSLAAVTLRDGRRRLFVADGTAGLPTPDPPDPGGYPGDANGAQGLIRIDISDPSAPVIDGSADTLGYALTLNADIHRVSLAVNSVGLLNFDPESMRLLSVYAQNPGWSYAVAPADGWTFLSTGSKDETAWLRAVDSHTVGRPVERGAVQLPSVPKALAFERYAEGAVVWATLEERGLARIDVSAPASPRVVSVEPFAGPVYDVELAGEALLVCHGAGLSVRQPNGSFESFGPPLDCRALDGSPTERVAVATPSGLALLDSAGAPVATLGLTGIGDVAVEGDQVVVTLGFDGALVLRAEGGALVETGRITTQGSELRGVDLVGGHAFLAGFDPYNYQAESGVRVVDLNGDSPRQMTFLHLNGPVERVLVRDTHLYAAASTIGLQIVDVGCAQAGRR